MVGEARSFTYRYQGNEHRVALSPLTSAREATWNARIDGEAALTITCSIEQGCLVLLRRGVEQQCLYAQQEKGATLVVYRGQSIAWHTASHQMWDLPRLVAMWRRSSRR